MSLVREPLLTLRGDLRIDRANEAFYRAFELKPEETENVSVHALSDGKWSSPALRNLLEGILPEKGRVDDFRIEHKFPRIGQRTMLFSACRLSQQSKGTQWTILAIQDVTEA